MSVEVTSKTHKVNGTNNKKGSSSTSTSSGGLLCLTCIGKNNKGRRDHPQPPENGLQDKDTAVPDKDKEGTTTKEDFTNGNGKPPLNSKGVGLDNGVKVANGDPEDEEENPYEKVEVKAGAPAANSSSSVNTTTAEMQSPTSTEASGSGSSASGNVLQVSRTSPQSRGHTPLPPPLKSGFLVSFMVDARGGAMTGGRGSGLRVMIPPGALDQPARVTCRYLRSASGGGQSSSDGVGSRQMLYPPPLMEREALASRVVEMGPAGAKFRQPVLLEVPHFASLRSGERELVVLRSDDGETWQEHTEVRGGQSGWADDAEDDEIYQDILAATGIGAAFEVLATDRVVRISTRVFPHYFAVLSRVREEVRAVGPEGGRISIRATKINDKINDKNNDKVNKNNNDDNRVLQVNFPPKALIKKIKVALQTQTVPEEVLPLVWSRPQGTHAAPTTTLRMAPLVALDPRRRRFHLPIQVSVPLPDKRSKGVVRKVRLLCSLAGGSSKATWEDVTEATAFTVQKHDTLVTFETRVSALFWVVALDSEAGQKPDQGAAMDDLGVLKSATLLYNEMLLPAPYMARIVVLARPAHGGDTSSGLQLRVYCVTDDSKAELSYDNGKDHHHGLQGHSSATMRSNKSGHSDHHQSYCWSLLVESHEIEVPEASRLLVDVQVPGGSLVVADPVSGQPHNRPFAMTFNPFHANCCNILVKKAGAVGRGAKAKLQVWRSLPTSDEEGDPGGSGRRSFLPVLFGADLGLDLGSGLGLDLDDVHDDRSVGAPDEEAKPPAPEETPNKDQHQPTVIVVNGNADLDLDDGDHDGDEEEGHDDGNSIMTEPPSTSMVSHVVKWSSTAGDN